MDPETAKALSFFRSVLIETLTGLQVEIATLEAAVRDGRPLTQELRQQVERNRQLFREDFANRLPPLHEAR